MGSATDILTNALHRRNARAHAIRVMIVDDSLTVRTILARMIDQQPDLEVVCKTSSAELALEELKRAPADVVLLDLEMPGMGGLNALPEILRTHDNIQVLVVSTLAKEGAEHTLTALSIGAADTMLKPRSGEFGEAYCDTLLAKIRALATPVSADRKPGGKPRIPARISSFPHQQPEVLAIGASTGGIHALCILLRSLPRTFDLPILITQHLPDSFISVFARQLEIAASREAIIGGDNIAIERGKIYVAPGDGHLNIVQSGAALRCKITHQPMPSGCVPSVDPMFETLARTTEGRAIGVVLSGMGRDGSVGAEALVGRGGTVFAQDQATSAVWGMPRAVAEKGLASAILPPAQLADKIASYAGAAAWK